MAKIIIRNDNTTTVVPSAGSFVNNEVAINIVDGKMWVKHTDGTMKQLIGPPGPPGPTGP